MLTKGVQRRARELAAPHRAGRTALRSSVPVQGSPSLPSSELPYRLTRGSSWILRKKNEQEKTSQRPGALRPSVARLQPCAFPARCIHLPRSIRGRERRGEDAELFRSLVPMDQARPGSEKPGARKGGWDRFPRRSTAGEFRPGLRRVSPSCSPSLHPGPVASAPPLSVPPQRAEPPFAAAWGSASGCLF